MRADDFFSDSDHTNGLRPAVHRKIPPDKILAGDEAKQAVAEFTEILKDKPPVPVHKRRSITKPGSSGSSPPTGAGKQDALKNIDYAKELPKQFNFGHICKSLYSQNASDVFRPLMISEFDLLLREAALEGKLPKELANQLSLYRSEELYNWLLADKVNVPQLPELPDPRYVAVKKGVLDLKKRKLLKKMPEKVVLFNQLDVEYKQYSKDEWMSSNTYRFLRRLAHPNCVDECVEALLYVTGKICSNDRTGKHLYFLYGDSNNGKSVFTSLIQDILGTGNYSNLSLSDLALQFSLINLRHTLVNISTDEATDAWNSTTASVVKRLSGHDSLTVDVKYERMQTFRPYCILLCAGNAAPKYSKELDAGAAISRRLFLLPTGPTVDDPDDDLLEKLLPEKDLFFSVAIDYFMTHRHPDPIINVADIIYPSISPKDLFIIWANQCVKVTDNNEELQTADFLVNYHSFIQLMPASSRMKDRTFEMELSARFHQYKSPSKIQGRAGYIGLRLIVKIYDPKAFGDY